MNDSHAAPAVATREARRTGVGLLRRPAVLLASLLLSVGGGGALVLPVAPAEGVYASPTGGSGRLPMNIDWMDWDTTTFAAGSRTTQWSTPQRVGAGFWRAIRCTITVDGTYGVNRYEPGRWTGDALARLYNNGVNYAGGVPTGTSTRSGMFIGLSNATVMTASTFHLSCQAHILHWSGATAPSEAQIATVATTRLPDVGMVVADAESSSNTGKSEYLAVSPVPAQAGDAVSFRHLESARSQGCATSSLFDNGYSFLAGGQARTGVRLTTSGTECSSVRTGGYGPSSVVLMEGANAVYAEVRGHNTGAVAFGVVSYLDVGDAPQSYGLAGSAYQPSWHGGEIAATGRVNLTSMQTTGILAAAGSPRTALGRLTDPDTDARFSEGADGDDLAVTGTVDPGDDEDSLTTVDGTVHLRPGATSMTQTVSCTGSGTLQGWIDWNRDGSFSVDAAGLEASDQVACPASGEAVLSWSVPAQIWNAAAGEPAALSTYMRLRIAGEAAELAPTGMTGDGEVEDYRVSVDRPVLTLVKEVDTAQAGPNASAQPHAWTLSAVQGTGTATGTTVRGAGTVSAVVMPGSFTLSESAAGVRGYEAGQWVCAPTAGTTQPDYSSSVLDATVSVSAGDEVTCTIRNTAVPATVTWTKTDEIGLPLAGSAWELTTATGQVLAVTDCVTRTQCPTGSTDLDPAAGGFTVAGLPWGRMTLTETTAPAGYVRSDQPRTLTVDGSRAAPGATNVTVRASFGSVVNIRITGSVTLTKTDTQGRLLDGSAWELTPVDDGGSATGQATGVTDCVAAVQCPEGSVDADPRAGSLRIDDLTAGRYALVETRAPVGYALDDTPVYFTIDTQG